MNQLVSGVPTDLQAGTKLSDRQKLVFPNHSFLQKIFEEYIRSPLTKNTKVAYSLYYRFFALSIPAFY